MTKAPGTLKNAQDYCEYIMFTSDLKIFQSIEANDWLTRALQSTQFEEQKITNRPPTGNKPGSVREQIQQNKALL